MAIDDSTENQDASPAPDAEGNQEQSDEQDASSNPESEDISEKYAAEKERASKLHKGLNEKASENKKLKAELAKYKELAGEEIEPEEPEEQPLTRAELESKIWELKYAKDIELYSDEEYEQDIENGIPKEYALKMAKLRTQSNPDKARLDRQQQMASGSASTRTLESDEITEKDRENMAKWGYSEEAIRKQKQLKKERGQT